MLSGSKLQTYQPHHNYLIVYGTNAVYDKEKIIINFIKHADELVRTSDPVIRSPTRYPWTNALATYYIQTDLLTVMILY